jgi:hypothetical protein
MRHVRAVVKKNFSILSLDKMRRRSHIRAHSKRDADAMPKFYAEHYATGETRVMDLTDDTRLEINHAFAGNRRAARWSGPYRTTEGFEFYARPASCGADCFCAADYKPVTE